MRRFGKYDVVDKIGEGGFGVVYEGFDPGIRRRVAIKTCTARDPAARARFQREAEIAGSLQHRNLTVLYDAGEQDGVPYLVQELLTGEDLDRKIQRGVELSFATKLLYLVEIARGLAYAHAQGIVHRDIKPANVRILDDGMVKILDFGIASHRSDADSLASAGKTVGTAAYLAPEQIWGAPVDQRADIHAFGVLAYELLSGERAFPGDDPADVMRLVLEKKPPLLRQKWPECPAALEALVHRCVSKDPELRYQTLTEVIRGLEALNQIPRPKPDEASSSEPSKAAAAEITSIELQSAEQEPGSQLERPGFAEQALQQERPVQRQSPPSRLDARRRSGSPTPGASTPGTAAAGGRKPISNFVYLLLFLLMGLSGAAGALWFQRGGGRETVSSWIDRGRQAVGLESTNNPPLEGAPATAEDSAAGAEATQERLRSAGSEGVPGSADARATEPVNMTSPAVAGDVDREFATLIVQPGWNPNTQLSISNQPAIRLTGERRFRLQPGVDHYLELSLVDGAYRITVPNTIRLENGEQRVLVADVPRPSRLTVRSVSRAPRVFVRIDGKALGWTPVEERPFAPGRYRLEAWPDSSTAGEPLQAHAIELRPRVLSTVNFDTRRTLPPEVTERRLP